MGGGHFLFEYKWGDFKKMFSNLGGSKNEFKTNPLPHVAYIMNAALKILGLARLADLLLVTGWSNANEAY